MVRENPKMFTRLFQIVGETPEEVQAELNKLYAWIESLPGYNYAEFRNPFRAGRFFVSTGYTHVSDAKSYESLNIRQSSADTKAAH